MDKCFLQLSKTGDLCNILPIAHAAHLRGEKVGVAACSEFSDILDGVGYAEKISFIGKPWEIEKAVTEAKKICANVVVTQTNGPLKEIEKYAYEPAGQKNAVTDSFARESWKLAGCLKEWGKTPLIFDRRDKEREKLLMPKGWFGPGKKKKIILLSAGSVSSPFLYKDLLIKLVKLQYANCNIIDLGEIKAHRFYDLLGLYEAAHCLISVDTSHLHLAAAVPTLPVMALIQDKPLYWHGTAWRPQHHFYCRYRDFPRRALELFTAIDAIDDKPLLNDLIVYHGGIKKRVGAAMFAIQPGSCRRDAVNVLNDKDHFPMLQDVIRMMMQVAKPHSYVILMQDGTEFTQPYCRPSIEPCYAYRMNRDKDGNDTFFPACDMFSAPVGFWVKIFPEILDVVMDSAPYWSRLLMELFKLNGGKEIDGIYRNE